MHTVAGRLVCLSRGEVEAWARRAAPERATVWTVEIEGKRFPVKQVVAGVTGLEIHRVGITEARTLLWKLGFRPRATEG
jgi:hypothetical protein